MKDHEVKVVADLLRTRLASKLTEQELTDLIKDITTITIPNDTNTSNTPQDAAIGKPLEKLKNSVEYIEYKCQEIERSLRSCGDRHVRPRCDRHVRPRRSFRDRSPHIGLLSSGEYPLLNTARMTIVRRASNPLFDSYQFI